MCVGRTCRHAISRFPISRTSAFFPADDRNYVVADEWNLKHVIEQAPATPQTGLGDVWSPVEAIACLPSSRLRRGAMKQERQIPGLEQLLKE